MFDTWRKCDSKVFFPDDPGQAPQFSDCPRQAETTRRAYHSVVKLCSKCAKVWDEQEEQPEVTAAACSRQVFVPKAFAPYALPEAEREHLGALPSTHW
jgi:hypothetical protein